MMEIDLENVRHAAFGLEDKYDQTFSLFITHIRNPSLPQFIVLGLDCELGTMSAREDSRQWLLKLLPTVSPDESVMLVLYDNKT